MAIALPVKGTKHKSFFTHRLGNRLRNNRGDTDHNSTGTQKLENGSVILV